MTRLRQMLPSGSSRTGPAFHAADLEEIVDHSPIAMCLATTEDGILRANHAAEQMSGRVIEDLLGRRLLHTFVHPDDVAAVDWVGARVAAGLHADVRHRLLTATGSVRHVRASITPILDGDGGLRYGLAQYVDETELVMATRRLEAQQRLLSRFAEVVAHDLRSPIAGVGGFASILKTRSSRFDTDTAEIIELIATSADEALDLIERTLARALREEDQPTLADLSAVVAGVTNLLGPNLAACGGRISFVGGARFIHGDPTALREILVNLCQNAIKYRSDEPPSIEIDVDVGADLLTVSDNGRGIPPDMIDTVFDRGVTVETGDDGHGTGLARVRSLVEALGGSINAVGRPHGGTTMSMHLPNAFVTDPD